MSKLKYKEGCYLAFVLSEAARVELFNLISPAFEKVICHHVTIAFKLNEPLFDAIMEVMGDSPTVVATGYMCGEHIDCFTVEVNGARRLNINDQHYHVTYSLEPPAKPVDSNKVIRSDAEVKPVSVNLVGSMQLVPMRM